MKASSVFFISAALVFALGGALLVRVLMMSPPAAPSVTKAPEVVPAAPAPSYSPVLAAAKDLKPGDFLDGSAVRWVEAEQDYSPLRYFLEDKDDLSMVFGATVREPIKKGALLDNNAIVHAGEPGFLASVLKPGMRAVAIPTNAVASNAGLVSAGDRVDVILGLKRDQEASGDGSEGELMPKLASQTLLTNVRVLALNNVARAGIRLRAHDKEVEEKSKREYYETVTLEVSALAAERLAVARELGTLQLALRSVEDAADVSGLTAAAAVPMDNDSGVTMLDQVTNIYSSLYPSVDSNSVLMYRGDSVQASQ
ncbi:Flp pilus assembly protein CpaB [Marinomonas transparens]|uniref:Flp pilus assembly protein CpaB n=1 Tax=Marinomonas transparens TaxID=2795388 RepID=A0A934JI12_9GAMM|nr:Flp pilus assembly protein CpaB [Marinomonas transparens]MBJ7536146.1 Flp pilus assembly protein CpaB [Marinomonas transparens]